MITGQLHEPLLQMAGREPEFEHAQNVTITRANMK